MALRKYLFLGLTLALGAVLVSLVMQGRKRERVESRPSTPVEIIRRSTPTPTRVLQPTDLVVVEAKLEAGVVRVVLHNRGGVTYRAPALRLEFRDRRGRTIGMRTRSIDAGVPPGGEARPELKEEGVPAEAASVAVTVLYADIQPAGGGAPPK